jgi:tetratricopeptide (TPR) repeat protein
MTNNLTKKQIKYIRDQYGKKTIPEIAKDLGISKGLVKKVATEKREVTFTRPKKIAFYSVAIIVPFLTLILIEITLRIAGYGNNYPLVQQTTFFQQTLKTVNPEITTRSFPPDYRNLPTPESSPFEINKSKNTYRIMCLGGSTTAGFPYVHNATFPFQLKVRLQKILTGKNIEVINFGISAVNSYTVLDILPEALEQQPDLILIYMGHNEFYGAYGVGSTQYAGMNRSLILLYLKLNKLRIVQLLKNSLQSIRGSGAGVSDGRSTTLMEDIVREPSPKFNPQYVEIASNNFKGNLEEILNVAINAQVPVMVCTLVSNLKDHEPFLSTYSEATDVKQQERWEDLFHIARNYQASNQHDQALTVFNQLESIDPYPARLFFFRGHSHLKLGNQQQAYSDFLKARDLDQLKFRAPGIFNEIIKDVTIKNDVPIVDMETVFRAASPDTIPGNNLFVEHLHPNFSGQKLIAETLLKAVLIHLESRSTGNGKLPQPLLSNQDIAYITSRFEDESGNITLLDLEIGKFRNFHLTNRWPFPEKNVSINSYRPLGNRGTKNIAIQYCSRRLSWELAHYRMAEYYQKRGEKAKALAEYMAVYEIFPKIAALPIKILDLYSAENKVTEALDFCTKAIEVSPENPLLLVRKALILMQLNQYKESISQLNKALQVDEQYKAMNPEQKSYLYYLMSMNYGNLQQLDQALKNIETSLQFNQNYKPAVDYKNTLLSRKMSRNSESMQSP